MQPAKALFILTSHDRLGPPDADSADPTGFHLSEAAIPWRVLTDAGCTVDFATPDGRPAPIDPSSRDTDDPTCAAFLEDVAVKEAIERPLALDKVDVGAYDAIYFPGGHGTMWDLPDSDAVQAAVRGAWESGKVVAAVCHGPAAFVNAKLSDGTWLVEGRTLSTFTDEEEVAVEKDDLMPFMLEHELKQRGATIQSAENFEAAVTVDGRLVTGQNPASAQGVGEAIRDQLAKRRAA